MNKQRRKRISDLVAQLQPIVEELTSINDEEEEANSNLPEHLQKDEITSALDEARMFLEDAQVQLESAME